MMPINRFAIEDAFRARLWRGAKCAAFFAFFFCVGVALYQAVTQ